MFYLKSLSFVYHHLLELLIHSIPIKHPSHSHCHKKKNITLPINYSIGYIALKSFKAPVRQILENAQAAFYIRVLLDIIDIFYPNKLIFWFTKLITLCLC